MAFLRPPSECLAEEVCGGTITFDPALPQKKIVDLIGKDQFLKLNILFAQALDQVSGLLEWNIAVIVAMNEQHRRFPIID